MDNQNYVRHKGFTLTEILAVLSIISLMATISVPPIEAYIRHLHFRSCLRRTSQLLRQGQYLSRKDYVPYRIVLENKDLMLQKKSTDVWQKTHHHCKPSPGIQIAINQMPVFYPSGAIVPLCTITVSQNPRSYSLTISAAGRIKIKSLH